VSYIAKNPEAYAGKVVGEDPYKGQCAVFVQVAAGAPLTTLWTQGALVKGNYALAAGTAIATFGADGKYTNRGDGTAHGAIYVSQDSQGIWVWNQWVGSNGVCKNCIYYRHGAAVPHVADGDYYYVIE
jgi:hypothetical protein